MPLLSYKWRSLTKLASVFGLVMVAFVATLTLTGMLTKAANTFSVTINEKPGSSLTAPVFTVVFSQPIDPASFTGEDIALTGSASNKQVTSIDEVAPNDHTTFEVSVTASSSGTIVADIPAANISYTVNNNGPFARTGDVPRDIVADSLGNSFVATNDGIGKITATGDYSQFAHLDETDGLTIDSNGNLYAAHRNSIHKVTPSGVVSEIGETTGYDGGAIAVDSSGTVYRVDENSMITKITADGTTTNYPGDGEGALSRDPHTIAVDNSGNVYAVDTANSNQVVKIATDGTASVLATLSGHASSITYGHDGYLYVANEDAKTVVKLSTAGVATTFGTTTGRPQYITVDASGNIFTADLGVQTGESYISKISSGGAASQIAFNCCEPNTEFTAVSANADGNFFALSRAMANIYQVAAGGQITSIGTPGSRPSGIAQDSNGNLYAVNLSSNNVSKITPDGTSTIFATLPHPGRKIIYGQDGNLYVYDTAAGSGGHITKITLDGVTSTFDSLDNYDVHQLVVDSDGMIYTINTNDNRVAKITPANSASALTTLSGNPRALVMMSDGTKFVAVNGATTLTKITSGGTVSTIGTVPNNVTRLAVDANGTVYAGNNTTVTKVASNGTSSTVFTVMSDVILAIQLDGAGNLYVTTNNHSFTEITVEGESLDLTSSLASLSATDGFLVDSYGNMYGIYGSDNQIQKAVKHKNGVYDGSGNGNLQSTSTDHEAAIVGPVTDFEVTSINSNVAKLSWDNPQLGVDQSYFGYLVLYKKHNESDWQRAPLDVLDVDNVNSYGSSGQSVVYGLEPGTQYDFRVSIAVFVGGNGDAPYYQTGWVETNGTTTAQQTIHISNCVQLQSISFNPLTFDPLHGVAEIGDSSAHYVLDNDIDCAGAADWVWMASTPYEFHGFMPIYNGFSGLPFTGTFDGQGFAIRNLALPSDAPDATTPNMMSVGTIASGLFSQLSYATVQNVKLENITGGMSDQAGQLLDSGGVLRGSTGLLTGTALSSTITGVSVQGAITTAGQPNPSGPSYRESLDNWMLPETMAADSQGNTYILSDRYIRKLDPAGNLVLMWQMHHEGSGDTFQDFVPSDIAVGANDTIYVGVTALMDNVGNEQHDRIQRYNTSGTYLGAFGDTGTDPGEMYLVSSIAATSNYVYALDASGHITRFNSDGSNPIAWTVDLSDSFYDIANPNLLAADNNGHLFYLNPQTAVVQRFDSDGSNGLSFNTNAQSNPSNYGNYFYGASAMGLDAAGHVYVSSRNSPTLQRFDNDGSNPVNWATSLWNKGPVGPDGKYTGFSLVNSIMPSGNGLAIFYSRNLSAMSPYQAAGVMHLDQNGNKTSDWPNLLARTPQIPVVGGLVGLNLNSDITKSSAHVDIALNGTVYQSTVIGGLVGMSVMDDAYFTALIPAPTQIAHTNNLLNNYSNGTITVSNGGIVIAGGLAGYIYGSPSESQLFDLRTNLQNSYSAGSITVHDRAKFGVAGGLVGFMPLLGVNHTARNLFSTTAISGSTLQEADFPNADGLVIGIGPVLVPPPGIIGGLIGVLLQVEASGVFTNNLYDVSRAGQSSCVGRYMEASENGFASLTPPNSVCTSINSNNSQPDYFKYNHSNNPLNHWDFSTIWRTNENALPTLGANTVPSPPRNFGGTPAKTAVTLAWQHPADNGGRPIVDYTIQYRAAGTSTWQTLTHPPSTATSYQIDGLTSGTAYEFQVAAVNEIGESTFVLGANITTKDDGDNNDPPNDPPPPDPRPPVKPRPPSTPVATPIVEDRSGGGPGSPAALVPTSLEDLPAKNDAAPAVQGVWTTNIPYVFVSLLLLIALIYAIMAYQEYRRGQAVLKLVEQEELNDANIKGFLDITSHYLNTPLAVLKGATELLASKKVLAASVMQNVQTELTNLETAINRIQTTNHELVATAQTQPQASVTVTASRLKDLIASKQLWIPLVITAAVVAITDVTLILLGAYKFTVLRTANIVAFLVLGGIALSVALAIKQRQGQVRAERKALLASKQQLTAHKRQLLGQSAVDLARTASRIHKVSDEFRQVEGTQTYFNGVAMLDKVSQALTNTQKFAEVHGKSPRQALNTIVDGVSHDLASQIEQKHLTVASQVGSTFGIQAEPDEARFLIGSLMENAVKFSPENGKVTISATSERNGTTIRVRDQGKGIASEELNRIMQPFARETSTQTYDYEGLGLGLYTNKLLVEKLGGTLRISNNRDKGITATIHLPNSKTDGQGLVSNVITPNTAS